MFRIEKEWQKNFRDQRDNKGRKQNKFRKENYLYLAEKIEGKIRRMRIERLGRSNWGFN